MQAAVIIQTVLAEALAVAVELTTISTVLSVKDVGSREDQEKSLRAPRRPSWSHGRCLQRALPAAHRFRV